MQSMLISRRDLDFLLFDWLRIDELTKQERFAEHSRDTFEAVLDLCEQLATRYFANHNKKSDAQEPTFDGHRVNVIPEVKEALDAVAQADLIAMTMGQQHGGAQLPVTVAQAAFAWFAIWIVGHVTYSALTAIPSFEAQRMQIEYQPGWRILTSPYQVLGNVQAYIFGFGESVPMAPASFAALLLVSAVSLMILFRRVNAPMRV